MGSRSRSTHRTFVASGTDWYFGESAGEAGVGYVTETVVKSDGAVAWIVDNFGLDVGLPPETVPYFEVKALDGAGLRTLAGGTDVHPSSLALAGSALYWTQGERAFSALLR
jgi:hypothetical protein